MTREDVIRMAREAEIIDFRDEADDPHVAQMVDFLMRFAALVAAAERRKHQEDIEHWKAQAAQAEKWRGMAYARHCDSTKVVPSDVDIAELRLKYGITSNGRGIHEFENVASFTRDALALWSAAHKPPEAHVELPEPDAWRYTDARGHFRYRGTRQGFAVEYPLLKPEALYTEKQVRELLAMANTSMNLMRENPATKQGEE